MNTNGLSAAVADMAQDGTLSSEAADLLRCIPEANDQKFLADRLVQGSLNEEHIAFFSRAFVYRDQGDDAGVALCRRFFKDLESRLNRGMDSNSMLGMLAAFEREFIDREKTTDVEWVGGSATRYETGLKSGRGLDIGTANLVRSVEDKKGNVDVRVVRDAFLTVRNDVFTRRVLAKMGVEYVILHDQIYVLGETAFELASLFEKETRRPLEGGLVSSNEQDALPVIKLLIQAVLGRPSFPAECCYFSVPAEPIDSNRNVIYHRGVFQGMLAELGYTPKSIVEGHAVVLSELADQDFTGIGISCGGGMFNVCVAYKAMPALAFSTTKGGDWIDKNVSAAVGIPESQATAVKEAGIDLTNPKGRIEDAIAIHYKSLIRYTIETIRQRFNASGKMPEFPHPVHIICSGGTSLVGGFIQIFRETFAEQAFPIEVAEIRLAESPLNSVATGCMLAALSESGK